MKCQTCGGKRYTTRTVANMQGPARNQYQSAIRPHVERRYMCAACKGTGQAPDDAPEPTPEGMVIQVLEVDGHMVDAPGFASAEQFLAFVRRAKHAQLRTTPAGTPGTVMVQSGSSPANYAVTRTHCSCAGHQSHGRCYHRALVIHLADVEGVDVCTVPTIGVNKAGRTVTIGRKVVGKAVAA